MEKFVKRLQNFCINRRDITRIELYFVERIKKKGENSYLFYSANLKKSVAKEIRNIFLKKTMSYLEYEMKEFNPVVFENEVCEYLDLRSIDEYQIIENQLLDEQNRHPISDKDFSYSNINFLYIKMHTEESSLTLFKRYSAYKKLEKHLILQIVEDAFNKLEDNKLAIIEDSVDLIAFDESLVIFNRYSFELILSYKDHYIEKREQALNTIKNSNLISGFEKFYEDCQNQLRVARKFTDAVNKGNLAKVLENQESLPEAILDFNLELTITDDGKINYEDKSQLKDLVTLLSDGFARTIIGKRNVSIESATDLNEK